MYVEVHWWRYFLRLVKVVQEVSRKYETETSVWEGLEIRVRQYYQNRKVLMVYLLQCLLYMVGRARCTVLGQRHFLCF